jgi:hypothetical protein
MDRTLSRLAPHLRAGVITRAAALAIFAAGMTAFTGLSGCASYVNYPAIGTAEEDAAVNDPNAAPAPTVTQAALRHVVSRFPVNGPYLVNLPQGMQKRRADEIVAALRDPNASLPTADRAGLPAFHVTRVWVRPSDKAQVEILRPIFGVGNPGIPEEYQPVTVKLRRSPLEAWQVDSVRVWSVGLRKPPALYGWPDRGPRGDTGTGVPVEQVPSFEQAPPTSDAGGDQPVAIE